MRCAWSSSDLWSVLHGVVCVHKPRDVSITALKRLLVTALCADANQSLPPPLIPTLQMPIVEPHPQSQALLVVGMKKQLDYSCHPLVVGEPFRKEDIRVEELHYLEPASSGVCLFGINDGCDQLESLRDQAWVNEYRVMGELGRETHNNNIRGKVVLKCHFDGVSRYRMNKQLSRVQAQYKRLAFELANVDLQSQEAFELARKGLPRAKILGTPIVYGIKLDWFKAPHFALTLSCVSETDPFLRGFIREVAVSVGTTASCRKLQCTRIGPFDGEHSLLDKHLTLSRILTNMQLCRRMINNSDITSDVVTQSPCVVTTSELIGEQLVESLGDQPDIQQDCLRVAWGREYTQV